MASFRFDPVQGFENNLDSFLQHMVNEEPELGAVLRAMAFKLKGTVDDGRRHAARTEFNSAVKAELDKLLSPTEKVGSK